MGNAPLALRHAIGRVSAVAHCKGVQVGGIARRPVGVGAISAWDEVLERFGTSNEKDLVKWVAEASIGKGYALVSLGDIGEAITLLEEVV